MAPTGRGSGSAQPGAGLGAPVTPEEQRAFLQRRLALLGAAGAVALGFLYLMRGLAHPRPANHLLIAIAALFVGAWLVCRRGRRSWRLLGVLDAALVPLACLGYALLALSLAPALAWDGYFQEPLGRALSFPLVMASAFTIIARAVIVPSPAGRTLAVSLAAAVPVLAAAHAYNLSYPLDPRHALLPSLAEAVWTLLAVALATLTAHVLYGLRERVRAASVLGQYRLEGRVGQGGMGVVYRARHALLRRPVALKLLPADATGQSAAARFEAEVQLTALLAHPNTVTIFDYGHTPDGVFYYVMELLDGVDLEALVAQEGPLPPARVVHVLRQVCGSLAEAHGIGLIHRDVKPSNVLLCRSGGLFDVVKVLDFGLVKDLRGADRGWAEEARVVAGTPHYLSPEAIRDPERVDARSDLYAVGALGYFLLAARPVFEGRDVVEVCGHHLHSSPAPPSRLLKRAVPGSLEQLLLACLEKDPGRRPQSAQALGEALDGLVGVGAWTQREARQRWAGRVAACDLPVTAGTPEALRIDLRERARAS